MHSCGFFCCTNPFIPLLLSPAVIKLSQENTAGQADEACVPGGEKKRKIIPVSCDVDRQMLENRFASSTPADICLSPVFVPAWIKCEKM